MNFEKSFLNKLLMTDTFKNNIKIIKLLISFTLRQLSQLYL